MDNLERHMRGTSHGDMEKDTMRPIPRALPIERIERDASGRAYFLGVRLTTAEDIERDTFRRKDYPSPANASDLEQEEGIAT